MPTALRYPHTKHNSIITVTVTFLLLILILGFLCVLLRRAQRMRDLQLRCLDKLKERTLLEERILVARNALAS